MWQYLKNIIQLIFSPDHGWEDIGASPSAASRTFRPMTLLLIIAALSPLVTLLYTKHLPTLLLWQSTVVIFTVYWATFFLGEFVMGLFIPRLAAGGGDARDNTRSFCAYVTGLLSLQVIVENLLPLSFAILQLWPVYVVIIIWRGMRLYDIGEELTGQFLLVTAPALILPSQILPHLFYNSFAR